MSAYNYFDEPSGTSSNVNHLAKLSLSDEINLYQRGNFAADKKEDLSKIFKQQSFKTKQEKDVRIKEEPDIIYDSFSNSEDPSELRYGENLLDFSQFDPLGPESKRRRNSSIRNRRISHTGNPYKCLECISSFTSKGNLRFHIKTVHEKVISYPCPKCDAVFSQKGNYKTHYNSVHLQIRPYECLICEAVFSQKGNLKTHLSKMHFSETSITDPSVLMKSPVTKKRGRPPTISLKNLSDI